MSYVVTAPAPLPWDQAAVLADVLAVLRLEPDDVDTDRVAAACLAATQLADSELDLVTSPWLTYADVPEPIKRAATILGVEVFRRKDAPFGRADSWSSDGAAYILSPDVMKGVRSLLAPYKRRWGVA